MEPFLQHDVRSSGVNPTTLSSENMTCYHCKKEHVQI